MRSTILRDVEGGITARIRVIPRSKRTTLAGVRGDCLVVKLTAPPVDNRANSALMEFLALLLDVPASAVQIVSGGASREKMVRVAGVDATFAGKRLGIPQGPL